MRSVSSGRVGALLVALLLAGCAVAREEGPPRSDAWRGEVSARQAIVDLLTAQAAAWNRGDLEEFMRGYWRSPELVFTSGGRVQRGWDTTLDRYRAAYGDRPETMGRLSFEDLEVHPLDDDGAWVLGRWRLDAADGVRGGVFTLVLRRIDGAWTIVHDHTTESLRGE